MSLDRAPSRPVYVGKPVGGFVRLWHIELDGRLGSVGQTWCGRRFRGVTARRTTPPGVDDQQCPLCQRARETNQPRPWRRGR